MRLQLPQIARQEADAIIFDVSAIPSLSTEVEIFLIFYLSKEDEQNGYGTVIQLDPQTKQAAIYADLNPEYTYLFYQNEQRQLQSLLWCIEVASRTSDGLFVAHAKSFGRGISSEDVQRFSQAAQTQNQPQTQHQLAEAYTPQAPTPAPAPPAPSMSPTHPQSIPANPAANTPAATSAPLPPSPSTPVAPPAPAVSAPLSFTDQPNDQGPAEELHLPPLPTTTQPAAAIAPANPNLPLPSSTAPPATNPAATTIPPNPVVAPPPQPEPEANPFDDIPDILSGLPAPTIQGASVTPKQPVGRPPKPLLQDQLWPVSPDDFTWVKTVSRLPINEFKEELHQKVIKQIRQNKPGLIEDWQFHGAFEQAFAALCATYDLIPALRHDILKSLLNGRVIENVYADLTQK